MLLWTIVRDNKNILNKPFTVNTTKILEQKAHHAEADVLLYFCL